MAGLPPMTPPKNLPPLPETMAIPSGLAIERPGGEEILERIEVEPEAAVVAMQSGASATKAQRPGSASGLALAAPNRQDGQQLVTMSASKRFRRGIDAESLVLNLTPLGLVDHLLGEGDINATDRWGWSCLHKAAIYGKSDHLIALLDAGADPNLLTEHDPSQIYQPKATALELAQCVDHVSSHAIYRCL